MGGEHRACNFCGKPLMRVSRKLKLVRTEGNKEVYKIDGPLIHDDCGKQASALEFYDAGQEIEIVNRAYEHVDAVIDAVNNAE
jgi:hypothetical protein